MASSSRSSRSPRSPNVGNTIQPYRMHVSQKYLDLTKQKLELTRLPREPLGNNPERGNFGVAKSELEPLIDYWVEEYDWRAQEAYYNDVLPQYRIGLNGTRLHFVHRRSQSPNAIPLLFVHGWPESFISVSHMIEALCNPVASPSRNGETPAFHVVVPSIPGFGFSDPVHEDGNCIATTAELFDSLMKTLGYTQYIVHGCDWGFKVCRMIALSHSDSCLAIHTANPEVPPPRCDTPTELFREDLMTLTDVYNPRNYGYAPSEVPPATMMMPPPVIPASGMQSPMSPMHVSGITPPLTPSANIAITQTNNERPQTLSYALCDSPPGLLAHLLDLIRPPRQSSQASSPSDAAPMQGPWTPIAIINWTMLHWLPGPEVALRWLTNSEPMAQTMWATHSNVPLAISQFGDHNTPHPSVMWAETYHRVAMLRRKTGYARFPAWERPIDLVLDLRELAVLIGPTRYGPYAGQ